MRHLWLLLLIAGGSVQFPGVLTLPEPLPAKSSSAAGGGGGGGGASGGGGVTAQAGGSEASSDYGEYEDDDGQRGPGNLAKSTAGPKIPDPYFEQKEVTIYVPVNATSVKLECPVKNYDAAHHVILWYKDGVVVTTGKTIVNNIYGLDNQFTLTVPLTGATSNATDQQFSCSANASTDIRHKVTIRFGPEPSTPAPSTVPAPAVTPSPANDAAPIRRDIGLWLLACLILAPLQLTVSAALF